MTTRAVLAMVLAAAVAAAPLRGQQGTGTGRGAGQGYAQGAQQGWLGISFACDDCSLQRAPRERAGWSFSAPPVVLWVDTDGPAYRAGLRSGDTLTAIDGTSLTTDEGGRAFARIAAGQRIALGYRRGGRERQATVTAGQRPEADAAAAVIGQYREAIEQQRRQQQEQMRRAQEEMRRAERELARLQREGEQRNLAALDSSRRRLLAAESMLRALQAFQESGAWAIGPGVGRGGKYLPGQAPWPPVALTPAAPATPVTPATPAMPTTPAMPAMPAMPAPRAWSAPPAMAPGEFSRFGNLRYSGRLRDVVNVVARGPGGVNVDEVGDSLVVVTSGDLSVRVALRPGAFAYAYTTPPVATATAAPGVSSTNVVTTDRGDAVYGLSALLLTQEIATGLGVPRGFLVTSVTRSSHADSLGITPGDVIVEINGNAPSLTGRRVVRRPRSAAGALTVTVVRGGERRTLRLGTPPRRRPI